MLDILDAPVLDKQALIGGCLKLPMRIDHARLAAEINALPESVWNGSGGRVGVQKAAQAVFLRGYAPVEGNQPIADREPLCLLSYVRTLITEAIPAPPQRCVLARLAGGTSIAPHVDLAPYFSKTLRLHWPVLTHDKAWMVAQGLVYQMRAGEVWALNNSDVHAVWNADPLRPRTHLICDFLATPALLDLLMAGERDCGRVLATVLDHFDARS